MPEDLTDLEEFTSPVSVPAAAPDTCVAVWVTLLEQKEANQ